MDKSNLKETHPQKYYLKLVCRILFYLGSGTYWYEDQRPKHPRLYVFWSFILNFYLVGVMLDEIFAYKRPDLTAEEMNEVFENGFGEAMVIAKIFVMFLHRHRIQEVSKTMIEKNSDIFTSLELERQSIIKVKRFFYPFFILCYSYITLTVAGWWYVSFRYEKPIKTPVIYFPTANDTGFFCNVLRIFVTCRLWLIVSIVTAIDCLCFLFLVFTSSKFQLVQLYFETLREKFQENRKLDEFKEAVVTGIKLHQKALWCARNVQYAIGNIYSIHISEAIFLLGICLIKHASMEPSFVNLVNTLLYLGSIMLITACYMITAGDITYEAAAVATSMFHCGWERARTDVSLRKLLVVGINQAQQPVLMTAFGVLDLSHESFIRVLRASYSFFAVVCSRN